MRHLHCIVIVSSEKKSNRPRRQRCRLNGVTRVTAVILYGRPIEDNRVTQYERLALVDLSFDQQHAIHVHGKNDRVRDTYLQCTCWFDVG